LSGPNKILNGLDNILKLGFYPNGIIANLDSLSNRFEKGAYLMNILKFAVPALFLAGAATLSVGLQAQTVVNAKRVEQTTVNSTGITMPANTAVVVRVNDEVNSKRMKEGESFTLSVVGDVVYKGYVVIPRGSRATGQITWRTGKGAFGKSGKMEVEITSVDVEGNRIATTGKFRQEGEGNTIATVGAVWVAGPFAAFVTGKSAVIPAGRELTIYTRDPVTIASGN
jgi:hypothetical protein